MDRKSHPGPISLSAEARPASLVNDELALVDIRFVRVITGDTSASWVHDGVRSGRFPPPAIREVRFTRWLLADVHAWIRRRVEEASSSDSAQRLVAKAKRASNVAKAKRTAGATTSQVSQSGESAGAA